MKIQITHIPWLKLFESGTRDLPWETIRGQRMIRIPEGKWITLRTKWRGFPSGTQFALRDGELVISQHREPYNLLTGR
jgi:hypothetical protein